LLLLIQNQLADTAEWTTGQPLGVVNHLRRSNACQARRLSDIESRVQAAYDCEVAL